MGNFKFNNCGGFEGLYEVIPKVFKDTRGLNYESYNEKDFFEAGLTLKFVQENRSISTKGVLRGLHFQKQYQQGKLVTVVQGEVFDAVVDLRKESKTYGKWFGIILSAENRKMLYVPKGFAHGFLVLSEHVEFFYKLSDFYHPEDESGVLWNDKNIGVEWPISNDMEIITSDRDNNHKPFHHDVFL